MTEEVYVTPNKEYVILKSTDPNWQAIFGFDGAWYIILRKEDSIPVWDNIVLKKCFKWLRQQNIISKDEMKYWIKQLCPVQPSATEKQIIQNASFSS